ncbi:MAG: prolipoprotein diacylglyceryl transferase [Anaerolineae bacterium]
MTPDPVIFRLGPLEFRWYGLLLVIGVLLGAFVASREARRRGQDPNHVWDGLLWCLIFGIVGARLYHVISSPAGTTIGLQYYLQHPIEILAFRQGGLGIYGAVAGGVLGLYIFARRRGLKVLPWLDIAAPSLLLGQAIGRWGNFFNQELYGYPTDLPWGIPIEQSHRLPIFADLPASTRFHPTFLYESIWNFLAFLALIFLARRFKERWLDGDIFALYLILYPLGRFFVEMQRPDAWTILGVAAAQIVAMGCILASVVWMVYRRRRAREAPAPAPASGPLMRRKGRVRRPRRPSE